MKRLLLIVLPLLLIFGCSSPKPINYEETLNERDGIYYTKDTNEPYSGQVFSLYDDGKKKGEGTLKDGKMINYTDIEWYKNGQKSLEETYKDGELISVIFWNKDGKIREPINYETNLVYERGRSYSKDTNAPYSGPVFGLYENGSKKWEGILNVGKSHGLMINWYENGQKEREKIYKNGKSHGLRTEWYENGQKKSEKIYKDGYEDGFQTTWYENGQKKYERNYRYGSGFDGLYNRWYENGQKEREETYDNWEIISRKEWNEDGSLKE